jgi:hypothetical protein
MSYHWVQEQPPQGRAQFRYVDNTSGQTVDWVFNMGIRLGEQTERFNVRGNRFLSLAEAKEFVEAEHAV